MSSEDEYEINQQQTVRNVEDPEQENTNVLRDNGRKKKKVCQQLGLIILDSKIRRWATNKDLATHPLQENGPT